MIIGAGGACRSIAVELASRDVSSIEIRNRSINKTSEIVNIIKNNFKTSTLYSTQPLKEEDLNNIDILINTTPIGMESELCPINEKIIPTKHMLVCDVVYKPHNTAFIKWAKNNGLEVIYGIDMLINQALNAFHIWTGIKPSKDDEEYIKDLYKKTIER